MKCAIDLSSDDGPGSGNLINLSTGCCAIESETLFQRGDYLGLRVYLPNQEMPVEVEVAAVRWASGREHGLEFIRIHDDVQKRLRAILPQERR